MGIDGAARNVIDQIGLEDYRLTADVDRKKAKTCGEYLVKLLGVLLDMEDSYSGSFLPSIRMIFGQKKRTRYRCARSQSRASNQEFPTSKAHCVTPNASNARGESSARQTTASVLVSSMLERSRSATREPLSEVVGRRCAARARIAHARLHGAVRVAATRPK